MSNERLEVLGGLPLFEPLSPDERERLAAGCRMRAFARGAALFREGERADGMHIVLRGVVKVVRFAPDGREMVLHLVRKGNTIGEAAMFQKGTFPASAVAVDDVETLFLPAVLKFGVPVNILKADTKNVGGIAKGEMILGLPEGHELQEQIKAYMVEKGLEIEEVTQYV